jgi:hypothetical protein
MKPLLSLFIISLNLLIVGSINLEELNDENLFKIIKEKNQNLNFLEETLKDDEKADKDLSFEAILGKKG